MAPTSTNNNNHKKDKELSGTDSFRRKLKKIFKSSGSSSRNSSKSSLSMNGSTGNLHMMNVDDMPPLRPIKFHGYSTNTRNRLITSKAAEDIRTLLPARLGVNSDWKLLYSLEQHGASLNSLYRILKEQKDKKVYDKNGYVLVIKDAAGGIFGAYVNEIFQPHELRRYYGNGECFLWSVERLNKEKHGADADAEDEIRFKGFPFTGVNDYLIYCQHDSISIGSSDGYNGIWIDKNLMHGVSQRCDTFGNDVLSKEGERFKIMGLEVWMI